MIWMARGLPLLCLLFRASDTASGILMPEECPHIWDSGQVQAPPMLIKSRRGIR